MSRRILCTRRGPQKGDLILSKLGPGDPVRYFGMSSRPFSTYLVSITIIQVVNIDFLLLLLLFLVGKAVHVVHIVIIILVDGLLIFGQGFCQIIQVVQAFS